MKNKIYLKLLTLIISLFCLVGCGKVIGGVLAEANTTKSAVAKATTTKATTTHVKIAVENDSTDKKHETTTTKSTSTDESVTSVNTTIINEQSSSKADTYGWKEYLADYEEFMNSYIELLAKQKKNPNNLTLMTDYLKALQKLTEFSEKSSQIQKDLSADPDAYKEYMETYMRIMQKLNEVE